MIISDAPTRAGARTFAGLFLVTLSTLTYQLLLTRTFSVTMYYHVAFVAISVTMFGMAIGALLVFLRPRVFTVAYEVPSSFTGSCRVMPCCSPSAKSSSPKARAV